MIEGGRQLIKVHWRKLGQRRLTRRCASWRKEIPSPQDDGGERDQKKRKFDLELSHFAHPAIKLATSCGRKITRTTITAAAQNMTMLKALRLRH